MFPSPTISGVEVWEGGIKKVTQWDWKQFYCLVIWSGFVPAEFKRLNPFQLSILAWTWKLSFSFCCISPLADQFLTCEKRYVNHSVFDLLGDIYFNCCPHLDLKRKMTWQIALKKTKHQIKPLSFVYISIYHFSVMLL